MIKAVAAYLHHQHLIPEQRLSEIVEDMFGCRMSKATIANSSQWLAQAIKPVVIQLAEGVKKAPLISQKLEVMHSKVLPSRLLSEVKRSID